MDNKSQSETSRLEECQIEELDLMTLVFLVCNAYSHMTVRKVGPL